MVRSNALDDFSVKWRQHKNVCCIEFPFSLAVARLFDDGGNHVCFIRIIDSRFTFRSISNDCQEFPPSLLAQSVGVSAFLFLSLSVSIPVFLLPRPSNKYSHSLALNIEKIHVCEQAVFSRHSAFSQLFLGCLLKKKTTNISGCLLPTPMAIDLRHWILPFPFAFKMKNFSIEFGECEWQFSLTNGAIVMMR